MPFQETITIINNSGKVISTGKQLLSIFKDAKAAYNEKKSHLRAQRGPRRAYTSYDDSRGYPEEYYYETYDPEIADEPYDDGQSRVSRQSRRSHRSHASRRYRSQDRGSEVRSKRGGPRRSGEALTVANLERLTEVGSTAPSRAPREYHSPYAETARGSMALSRPNLNPGGVYSGALDAYPQGDSMAIANRTLSEPCLVQPMPPSNISEVPKKKKDIDMNLAYGSLPPDLEERVDLDPNYGQDHDEEEEEEEEEAAGLIEKIEGLLDEAQCMQHSATAIMEQLQQSPERAAAVALTLAKLSTIVGKMTPAFAGVLKGSSPAVFALLASPQFLIATGVAVGVTIVMFGGWKIVKRVREQKAKEEALAYEMAQMNINAAAAAQPQLPEQEFYGYDNQFHPEDAHHYYQQQRPPTVHPRAHSETGHSQRSMDEALVLDEVEELSTIESWRRGIVPFGEDQSADMELISPEANRAMKDRWRLESQLDIPDDVTVTANDSVSQAGGRRRRKPHHGGSGSGRSEVSKAKSHRSHRSDRNAEVPNRKSSRGMGREDTIPEEEEDAKSSHSSRSHKSSSRSHASHASHKSSRSKHTSRVGMKAIEDGSRDKTDTLSSIFSGGKSDVGREKEKKAANMLKSIFMKKKEREAREREGKAGSVLVKQLA